MRIRNILYGILICVLILSTAQCCTKKPIRLKKTIEVESTIPETDSDGDGVVDYMDEEPEFAVGAGHTMELEITDTLMAIDETGNSTTTNNITVQKYELGRIVYEIPKEMEKLKTYTIQVNIARDTLNLKIYDGMKVTVDTIIRTSSVMRVELSDPTGEFFKIITKNEQQFIEIDEHTSWIFYVTPLKSGSSELVLSVSIMKDGNVKQTTYKDSVIVKTTPTLEITLWIQQYWQWAFGVFIIPLVAFLKKKFFTLKNKS